ncbi:MAG: endonuclease/exonuclease/phosphatase family protein [Dysgonamonadaceae bacterium]|jgi:exonuclease III|nr:endonuclease/exonuclease/phosphatase family protein [Dysgonamonadaceae bacterium]
MKKQCCYSLLSLLLIACSAKQELSVLQINAWHGASTVPGGFKGLVDIVVQTNPDIVLLCEIQAPDGSNVVDRLVDSLQTLGKTYYGQKGGTGLISKYKIDEQTLCCASDVQGAMVKSRISVGGHTLLAYSAHLDYTHYECYLPRGYSGTSWKKIESPVRDADSVLRANRLSQRDETIAAFIEDAKNEIGKGNLVLMGGDLNEPSHLDWQADTKNLRDHNGVVINWDCSLMLADMGMVDAYREKYPDAVEYPGFTFPAGNRDAELNKLAWAPEADERDRIDFIYYYPNPHWTLKSASIVGPEETVLRGKIQAKDSEDAFVVPLGVWATDHKGNLAVFTIRDREK